MVFLFLISYSFPIVLRAELQFEGYRILDPWPKNGALRDYNSSPTLIQKNLSWYSFISARNLVKPVEFGCWWESEKKGKFHDRQFLDHFQGLSA